MRAQAAACGEVRVNLKTVTFSAVGALLMWGVFRRLKRFRRTRLNITPVSERWLAEQRGAPSNEY